MKGNQGQFYINGKLSAQFTDEHEEAFKSGVIGLQLHDPGMSVAFKDLRIKP